MTLRPLTRLPLTLSHLSFHRVGSEFDLASLPCCDKKETLASAIANYNGQPDLLGFDSSLDLLLFRANGEIDYDKAGSSIKYFSFLNQFMLKDSSIRWMEMYGELIHPGIVCVYSCLPDSQETSLRDDNRVSPCKHYKKEKLQLISILLNVKALGQKKICEMLSITRHNYRKTVAFCQGLIKFEIHRRVKYSKDKITSFITFLSRSDLIATLPFGDCQSILSDGTRLTVASIARLYSYSRIIKEYFKELERTNAWALKLGRTSLYLILRAISKRKNKQLYCVDEFMGEAFDAFDSLETVLISWFNFGKISNAEKTTFKQGLRILKLFSTEFRSHVQPTSEIASHCIQHALSDRSNSKFSTRCLHPHDTICLQCERVDSVLRSLIEKARSIGELAISSSDPHMEQLSRLFEIVNIAEKSILKYRRHLLRSAASDMSRIDTQHNLGDNECLLTVDFAMKLLASNALETQSGFFAKKGTSFHISHALIRLNGKLFHHVFAHVINEGEQDCDAVSAILRHVMTELLRLGITKVSLKSDNAGTYKAASVIATLQSISSDVPLIVRYAFSETQCGNGPCDRASAYLKRSIKWWNESGRNATTSKEMYDGLTDSSVKGCSIYLVNVVKDNDQSCKRKKPEIPGISGYFDFRFTKDLLVANKYWRRVEDQFFLSNAEQCSPDYYRTRRLREIDNCWVSLREKKDNEEDKVDDIIPVEENPYRCATRHCTKSFMTIEEYDDHTFKQDHSYATTTETMLDVAKKDISMTIETHEAATNAVNESDLLTARCDEPSHEMGWAVKDTRAPRMDSEVKAFAENFFLEHRAEGKRASPAECCELIRNAKTERGAYRFPLHKCPNEKSLTSTFGTWESKRLRPKATAARGGGGKRKTAAASSGTTVPKRKIADVSTDVEEETLEEEEDEIF